MIIKNVLDNKAQGDVIWISPSETVRAAAEMLSKKRIGALIVSDDGESALGILSERDIVREIGAKGPQCLDQNVSAMMTRKLVTCARGDQVVTVLQKMTTGRFRHMPLVENGRLLGIVTLGDLVKARLDELNAETEALQSMIMGR